MTNLKFPIILLFIILCWISNANAASQVDIIPAREEIYKLKINYLQCGVDFFGSAYDFKLDEGGMYNFTITDRAVINQLLMHLKNEAIKRKIVAFESACVKIDFKLRNGKNKIIYVDAGEYVHHDNFSGKLNPVQFDKFISIIEREARKGCVFDIIFSGFLFILGIALILGSFGKPAILIKLVKVVTPKSFLASLNSIGSNKAFKCTILIAGLFFIIWCSMILWENGDGVNFINELQGAGKGLNSPLDYIKFFFQNY